jgi:N-acetyl-gamma-glutamyl-phosphate reductase
MQPPQPSMTKELTTRIKAGIAGGAGYTGGELIRLLLHHPNVAISCVYSKSQAGLPLHQVHKDLITQTDMCFSDRLHEDIDVLFCCVGHGEARQLLDSTSIAASVKIIDLSQDFRLLPNAHIGDRQFVYGLPELNRETIRRADNIANPGCFATAIQLALLPMAQAGLLTEAYTTGITGSTGAGQGLSNTSHFSWRANNIQAYKTLEHQHLQEITQSLQQLQTSFPNTDSGALSFVPWRGDFARGIYTSTVLRTTLFKTTVIDLYKAYYQSHPFTTVSDTIIDLKQVVNTNHALIHIEKQGDRMAVHSAIDNLLKGASGQAVQNMNLLFGLDEQTGLHLKANYF